MAFVIGTIIAVLFLDGIARVAVIAAVALIEIAEIGVWLKWRKVGARSGIEAMVGMTGTALTDCDPDGQVKVKGQIWKAHSSEQIEAGDEVRVTGFDGLLLKVAPL